MSYSIQYGPNTVQPAAKKPRFNLLLPICTVLIPLFILTLGKRTDSNQQIDRALLPWEQAYVQEAFSDFTVSIQSGESLKEAIVSLYRQITYASQTE